MHLGLGLWSARQYKEKENWTRIPRISPATQSLKLTSDHYTRNLLNMLSRWPLAALCLLPAQLAFADSTKTLQACTTLLGKSSKSPVPTASIALTFTSKAVVKSTSTPVTTITPAPGTTLISTTLTSTTTSTLVQQTDTFSSTQTSVTTCKFHPRYCREIFS